MVMKMMNVNESFSKQVCKIVDCLSSCEAGVKKLAGLAGDLIKVFLDSCLEPTRSSASINNCLSVIISLIKCSSNV
jgi:hypothetical protein